MHSVDGFSAQSDRRLLFGLGVRAGRVSATMHWCGRKSGERIELVTGVFQIVRQRAPKL